MYSKDALSVQLFVVNGTQSLFKQSLFLLKSASLVLSVLCRGIFFFASKKSGQWKKKWLTVSMSGPQEWIGSRVCKKPTVMSV